MPAPEKKAPSIHLGYFLTALFLLLMARDLFLDRSVATIPYSQFQENLAAHNLRDIYVDDQYIYGHYKAAKDGKDEFVTPRIDPQLAAELSKYGVPFQGVVHSHFWSGLLGLLGPILFFFLIWYFGIRRLAEKGGLVGVSQNKAKIYVDTDTGVTFAQVAGVDEAKAELRETIDYLSNPKDYGRLGARTPKGILLVGPPGTGKTMLAKAVAGEAKVPFFSITGAEFIEMFVGVGAARVRDLFTQAKAQAPAIIFIDELDALGRARGGAGFMGGHDEREQTLNQLLAEMDGFDSSEGVVIIAATNRPEVLDAALLRAGRFDRQILVDRPDRNSRLAILKVHVEKIIVAPDVDLDKIAATTTGFSGADIANLVNEAAIQATRRKATWVGMQDFNAAIERIVAGLEKRSRLLTPFERRVTAFHELGHALVGLALPGVDEVHKVSIVQRGIGALGYTIQRPAEDRYLMTKEELTSKIAVLVGGQAAEMLVFNHTSTGAADDLAKATDIARAMATRYGMDESLGHVAYDAPHQRFLDGAPEGMMRACSESTSQQIDVTVRRTIDEAFARATKILQDNRDILDACAEELLKTETLDEERLKELTVNLHIFSPSPGEPPAHEQPPVVH